jgi:Flp pilus assembly protein TadG
MISNRFVAARRSCLRDRSGQSMIEIALILPVLLLVVIGILEFGMAFSTRQTVTEAARSGARDAVVLDPSVDRDEVRARIVTALNRAGIPNTAMAIDFDTVSPPGGHWRETGALQTVSVAVQYRFNFLGPLLKAAIGKETITIESVVTMRNE